MLIIIYPLLKKTMAFMNIVGLLFFSACANGQKADVVGNYKSKKYSKIEIYLRSINGFNRVSGNTLKINSDSTFEYSTCAQASIGFWWCSNDSLFLQCTSIRFKRDSLNSIPKYAEGLVCGKMPNVFIIEKKGIVQQLKLKGNIIAENYLIKE